MEAWVTRCLGLSLLFAGPLSAQTDPASGTITRVDHFYAESPSATALLEFLIDDLALPVAWPYEDFGSFASGAVSLGNVGFEVVRSEQSGELESAQFFGIALEPEGNTQSALAWLIQQGVDHATPKPFPADGPAAWENTALPGLIPGTANVFVCDYKDRSMVLEGRRIAEAELTERGGGPLGVVGVRELAIGSADLARSLERWSRLVPNARQVGDEVLVDFDSGPRIRIQKADSDRFAAVVLMVRSIEGARAFLEAEALSGSDQGDSLSINPRAVGGLRIRIAQAP